MNQIRSTSSLLLGTAQGVAVVAKVGGDLASANVEEEAVRAVGIGTEERITPVVAVRTNVVVGATIAEASGGQKYTRS